MDKTDAGNVMCSYIIYNNEPSEINLKILCSDIQKMCDSVYGNLRTVEEKNMYYNMANSLAKF